jgi:hypothetical protein
MNAPETGQKPGETVLPGWTRRRHSMSDQEKTLVGTDEGRGQGFEGWWEDRSIPEKIVAVIGFMILGIGLLSLFGLVVMALWNWLMPEIFGLKALTYWQAWGMLVLSCILFGRIGGSGSSGKSDRKRKRQLRGYMREARSASAQSSTGSPTA